MSSQRIDKKSAASPASLAQFQPHKAESYLFTVTLPAVAGGIWQVVQCPNFRIPPGAQITLHPYGPAGINTNPIIVGEQYESVLHGTSGGLSIPPDANVALPFALENLNELWVTSGNSNIIQWLSIKVIVPAVG